MPWRISVSGLRFCVLLDLGASERKLSEYRPPINRPRSTTVVFWPKFLDFRFKCHGVFPFPVCAATRSRLWSACTLSRSRNYALLTRAYLYYSAYRVYTRFTVHTPCFGKNRPSKHTPTRVSEVKFSKISALRAVCPPLRSTPENWFAQTLKGQAEKNSKIL